jgi:hypothetical protein
MYTTPSPGTEEGGELYSAVDFIAHERHEGGCIPFRKRRNEDVGWRGIHVTSVVRPAMANRISTCSNTPVLEVLKCYHYWEYKCGMEATTNAATRLQIKELFIVHIRHQMEERRDYWLFKRSAMITPDFFMSLIVDGMDQNTTMVPKMKQTVKNIESRFVKTHLCGVLVHGIELYADVWIDAHHKHDSNQVITSVMHVIANVRRRKGRLPLTLRIQADNCTRENKNIYMFTLCAALVGLGYFQEVQLCFLIVGHTHENIDQCFSIISSTLKRTNIDSLKELLELV